MDLAFAFGPEYNFLFLLSTEANENFSSPQRQIYVEGGRAADFLSQHFPVRHQISNIIAPCWTFVLPFLPALGTFQQLFKAPKQIAHTPSGASGKERMYMQTFTLSTIYKPQFVRTIFS